MSQRKRYQIFVSSTFADLGEERAKVMETILNFNCFPAGMELFPAMDEGQFEYIKRIIDDSDYYLLIIGGRYGSVADDGVSWTEKEYDYAVSKGIPVIAIDHKDFTQLPANKTDQDDTKRKKLIAFKKKVAKGRLIKYWSNADNLALAVARSLPIVFDLQPRMGWVRADARKEIDRLQKEIADREAEINKLQSGIEEFRLQMISMDKNLQRHKSELERRVHDYSTLESKYNDAQQQIENHQEKIKSLEAELEKYKDLSVKSNNKTETFTVKGVSFKMVLVEGGKFMMGANEGDKESLLDERPAHEVTLSDYWMGETQVTQALWQAVMGENSSDFGGDPNRPVESVSWEDCQIFIRRLNRMTGKKFHLPTEAQWEFAARGGNLGKDYHYRYSGSNDFGKVAWNAENANIKTHPVMKLKPNELGLYDMSGNVYEWCNDRYDSRYYSNSPAVDPKGPAEGSYRVCRGGSWISGGSYCRVSCRNYYSPTYMNLDQGLRLAL